MDLEYLTVMKHIRDTRRPEYWDHFHHVNTDIGRPSATIVETKVATTKVKPSRGEVARKAYSIYLREGCPQGRDVQHWLAAEIQLSF